MSGRYAFIELNFQTPSGDDTFLSGILDTSPDIRYDDSIIYAGFSTNEPTNLDLKITDWRFI